MTICKYCKQDKPLIKAHILPKKFYTGYEKVGYGALSPSGYTRKRFQSGIFDNNILCSDCDNNVLGEYDKEAYRLLVDIENKRDKESWQGASAYIYQQNEFDFDKIRKFFIALLWKASISKLDYMKTVDLGLYEDIALDLLKDKIKDDKLFRVIINKTKANTFKGVHSIRQCKNILGKNSMYVVYFDAYIALIFVRYRGLPYDLCLLEELFISNKKIIIVEDSMIDDIKFDYFRHFKKFIK